MRIMADRFVFRIFVVKRPRAWVKDVPDNCARREYYRGKENENAKYEPVERTIIIVRQSRLLIGVAEFRF